MIAASVEYFQDTGVTAELVHSRIYIEHKFHHFEVLEIGYQVGSGSFPIAQTFVQGL